MRNSTIRVATFTGPGAEPVIRPVPWPQVQKNAAQLAIRRADRSLNQRGFNPSRFRRSCDTVHTRMLAPWVG